jgi:3-hydroxyisobutyrate dehydrogenase
MVLGVKAGIEPQRLFDILSPSGGRSPYFGIGLSRKDVSLALGMAAKLEVPMFVASAVRQVYEAAHAQGFGQLDIAAVTRLYEDWTGVTVRGVAARDGGRDA